VIKKQLEMGGSMKKIAIILCEDVYTCPYIGKYLEVCKEKSIEYDILCWNRSGKERTYPANYLNYGEKSNINTRKILKLFPFLRFGYFLRKTIRQEQYDKLIVLTTLPAVLCYGLLTRKYRGKYIFDFRDMSFEKNKLFLCCVQKICDRSFFTCISSPGFEDVLGDRGFVPVHNFRYEDLKSKKDAADELTDKIHLVHVGIGRGDENNKLIADSFGNDPRFRVTIVGRGNDTPAFVEYIKKYSNITVGGTYDIAEKERYIKEATMLLCYYPCTFNGAKALANRHYDGIIYKKPLLGNIDTYGGKRLMEKGLGISLNLKDTDAADKVYSYISQLDMKAYNEMAEKELAEVLQEDEHYLLKIREFLDT
jgi:hypothetical protein